MGKTMNTPQKTTLASLLKAIASNIAAMFYGKEEPTPANEFHSAVGAPAVGEYWQGQGGYYAGIMRDGEKQWHLILPRKELGLIDTSWGNYNETILGTFSRRDGQHNTALILAADQHNEIASHFTALLIDGHKDCYWPSQCENNLLFANIPEQLNQEWHWSSTQHSTQDAWFQYFDSGYQSYGSKGNSLPARAVRRIFIESPAN